jgi:hypothetical protein
VMYMIIPFRQNYFQVRRTSLQGVKHLANALIFSNNLLTLEIVREIFFPSHLSRMMYFAAGNHLRLSDPKFGVVRELNFDEEGARRIKEERGIVFGHQGVFHFVLSKCPGCPC